MNIEEFFELSAGKWFAHRSKHNLAERKSIEAKSELVIEKLPATHPEVAQVCEQYQVTPTTSTCGLKINWNDTTKLNQKNTGTTVLVLIPDTNNAEQGQMLRQLRSGSKAIAGSYKIASDESVTLSLDNGIISFEERIWFASPNLRMRSSMLKNSSGFSTTSFTSEIRMGGTPAKASETANSASN